MSFVVVTESCTAAAVDGFVDIQSDGIVNETPAALLARAQVLANCTLSVFVVLSNDRGAPEHVPVSPDVAVIVTVCVVPVFRRVVPDGVVDPSWM